ncbi:MAG TPA: phosphatidate cytidylyltransferase [Candidatus Sumerlaeota bacterium]|nr:MAG: Phosphatidate cytidylyltransferase [candidate division BRC1 bacterium ADurb.Bin183]HOE62956.1 phosphatidate cytidylyltransferase [Candidatus Sumerlaeota bacterium]HRR31763.1 phosphatidate cytidylyltransferase [Candidatus Sumerlaeia bacterium]HON49615.1 phosphatidate cytidylyltransferase [Candidatus Sumerlaeota bacterium]HOR64767.1 phosphatidate cytidylyltransferase [Candidatus Sumerlaeota bacterium]
MAVPRTITGLIMAGVIFFAIFVPWLAWVLYLFLAASAIIGVSEYYKLAERAGVKANKPLLFLATSALLADAYFANLAHFPHVIILSLAMTAAIYVLTVDFAGSLAGGSATLFGALWAGLPMALGITILNQKNGNFILGTLFAINFMTDIGAYIIGCNLGRHKLCPRLSPKKTIEGSIGGLVFAQLGALFCWFILGVIKTPLFTIGELFSLAVLFGVTGQIGDLVESGYKRDAGVKNSGNILHGHGGILDRMDSLIFSLPLLYLYLLFFPR